MWDQWDRVGPSCPIETDWILFDGIRVFCGPTLSVRVPNPSMYRISLLYHVQESLFDIPAVGVSHTAMALNAGHERRNVRCAM